MKLHYLAGACLALALGAHAEQQQPNLRTIFGIQIGAPLSVPECPIEKTRRGLEYALFGNPTCYKQPLANAGQPVRDGKVTIQFAASKSPSFLTGNALYGTVIAGQLEKVEFETFGYNLASAVREELELKYGKPTGVLPQVFKNGFGATFEAYIATWQLPDLHVAYASVATSLKAGRVWVETDKGKQAEPARRASSL